MRRFIIDDDNASILPSSYLLSVGASTEAENESGEKPADLIDPDCKELAKLFEVGCVWMENGMENWMYTAV